MLWLSMSIQISEPALGSQNRTFKYLWTFNCFLIWWFSYGDSFSYSGQFGIHWSMWRTLEGGPNRHGPSFLLLKWASVRKKWNLNQSSDFWSIIVVLIQQVMISKYTLWDGRTYVWWYQKEKTISGTLVSTL